MRWDGQQATDAGALLPLRGLIRSITTPEFAGVTFHEVLCKSALNKVPGGSNMPFTWTINTTRGCLHQCSYCFARKTHEYLDLDSGADFDTQIVVKTNVAEVLAAEVAKPSWRREHVALGTNSDPYMRAEGRYRLMPGVIQALTASRTPFSILTKGPLLRRDLPLISAAAERVDVGIGVSLAFTDPQLQQRVEPGTPTPKARLDLIRAVADAGLQPTVMAMPILPWLTDSTEHLDELFGAIREAGGTWVTAGPLHLRPGAREWFMAWLAREYPALVPKYRALFGRGSYTSTEYREWLSGRVREMRRQHGFVREETQGGARWTLRTDPDAVGDPPAPAALARADPRPAQTALF
ncbi:Rv2578c family radical SAM protein [Ruania alba]|uniref:DNA repair photolyase n=1 Tax=Ruania alba TaxID=648782 RepID=A0A1H5KFT1_9MICO|nr:Rv2578c family radical SAM protein [Ruania alba]SEE62868.1 DNA repair photolyase [Ruania alba]